MTCAQLPQLGVGVALRREIDALVGEEHERIDWLEVITEDFTLTAAGRAAVLELRGQFPLVPHGVELSLGSQDPLDMRFVGGLG